MVRLTVAQALVKFLAAQQVERDGARTQLFAGCLGIFGHGNVAGVGQALLQDELDAAERGERPALPYVLARNEQAMVHTAVGYARQRDRLQVWACTASVGPGSTNMITGAALATTNRIPVLLLPSGTFATRVSAPVLQELEVPYAGDVTVNDAFRPLSRFFDEVTRPEQLPSALLGAMRALTDQSEAGAVTLSLPQDVQAEAFDWPDELFAERVWRIDRPRPDATAIDTVTRLLRGSARPLVVAGGGVHYAQAEDALARFAAETGVPVCETQAGKGSLLYGHPQLMGAVGSTGTTAANSLAAQADLVIGIGTRWSDFTTASRTAFAAPGVRFVNINIGRFDAVKHAGVQVVGDAREALAELTAALAGWSVPDAYRTEQRDLWAKWDERVSAAYAGEGTAASNGLLAQNVVLGVVNEHMGERDVVLCAAGSMPGDLHKMWRVRDRKGYHVEYAYSCMGYEVPASIGVKWAQPDSDVFAMVGDGGYLMMPTELVTAVQERTKVIVVLVQNRGFHSIGSLSESLGSQRFGTRYRMRGGERSVAGDGSGVSTSGRLDGELIDIDLAANARSLGAHVIEVTTRDELVAAVAQAKALPSDGPDARPVVIHVETDPFVFSPDNGAWWDVPVAEVSSITSTAQARADYEVHKKNQRPYVGPEEGE